MRFTELMLLYTAPMFWVDRPRLNADNLGRFLASLLDPGKPGYGGLRPYASREPADWRTGDAALEWIVQTHQKTWVRGADSIERFGDDAVVPAFNLYVAERADVVVDGERLGACLLEGLDPQEGTAEFLLQLHSTLEAIVVGLSIDWASAETLLWAPQLRISNFWPRSPRLAPPPPAPVAAPEAREPEGAAEVLLSYWLKVETAISLLRQRFGLGVAMVSLEPQKIEPSLFFYATPEAMCEKAEDFVAPPHLQSLEALARRVIGTQDLLSSDVSGAFLEGNLLTFRHERVRDERWQSLHLIVPWIPGEGDREEVERELCFVADKLAFVDFSAGWDVQQIMSGLAIPRERMSLWGGTLDSAAALARELQISTAFQARRSRPRAAAFRLVGQLRASLSSFDAEFSRVTDDIVISEVRWRASVDAASQYARNVFTARPLPRVNLLLEKGGLYRMYGDQVDRAARRANQLRDHFRSTAQALENMLDQERREQREHDERSQKVVGFGLAALAAVTAFPILIGSMDWETLRDQMRLWPRWGSWLGRLLEDLHPLLTLIAALAALGTIGVILGSLVWTLLPDVWTKTPFSGMGRKVVDVTQRLSQVSPLAHILRRVLSGHTMSTAVEQSDVKELRQVIDAQDRRVCELVVEVMEWLLEQGTEADGTPAALAAPTPKSLLERWRPTSDLTQLEAQVHRFIIARELFDNRPTPLLLPTTLCLLRYQSTRLFHNPVVSTWELRRVLRGYGFSDQELDLLETAREHFKALRPGQCVEELRTRGITVFHERPFETPTGAGG